MLPIVQAPNNVLSQPAKKITRVDKSIKKLIDEMADTLINATDPEGIGLAAPQVGKNLQLFIIKENEKAPLKVFINPEIISLSEKKHPVADKGKKKDDGVKLEGCLSLKDIWGVVHRSAEVKLSYLDENGKQCTQIFTGFLATIIQHEYDHLQGTLFPKRVLEQKEKLYKSINDEKGEMVFEELDI